MSTIPWIVSALAEEVKTIQQEMEIERTIHLKPAVFYQGHWRNFPMGLLVSGMGAARMTVALEKMSPYGEPTSVCHLGYAGAASPLMGVGRLLIAQQIKERATQKSWAIAESQVALCKKICESQELNYTVGGLLTVPHIIADSMEKAALGSEERVLALDMESSAVAAWATAWQIPFCVVRAIFDPLDMAMPAFVEEFQGPQPTITELMRLLAKHPKEALKIPQLQYCANTARNNLTQFACAWSRSP